MVYTVNIFYPEQLPLRAHNNLAEQYTITVLSKSYQTAEREQALPEIQYIYNEYTISG
jgi:hypothetical protein